MMDGPGDNLDDFTGQTKVLMNLTDATDDRWGDYRGRSNLFW